MGAEWILCVPQANRLWVLFRERHVVQERKEQFDTRPLEGLRQMLERCGGPNRRNRNVIERIAAGTNFNPWHLAQLPVSLNAETNDDSAAYTLFRFRRH
jgi:hypothetical protein